MHTSLMLKEMNVGRVVLPKPTEQWETCISVVFRTSAPKMEEYIFIGSPPLCFLTIGHTLFLKLAISPLIVCLSSSFPKVGQPTL